MKSSLSALALLSLAACDPSIGYTIEVTVTASTLASLDDPANLGVLVRTPSVPRLDLSTQPLDGSTSEQVLVFDADAIVSNEEYHCPDGPFEVSLVRLTDLTYTGQPLDPAIQVEAEGDCPDDGKRFIGSATL